MEKCVKHYDTGGCNKPVCRKELANVNGHSHFLTFIPLVLVFLDHSPVKYCTLQTGSVFTCNRGLQLKTYKV